MEGTLMQSGEKGEAAAKSLEPGDMFGDYTVEKLLGKGGMGAVYLVRAPGGERYAVKVMSPEMVKKGSDYRKRFAREAEFAMNIRHKNLISVYDVGEDPETGLCYIIMDYVPGGSVADRLEQGGPLPMAEAVSIAAQVALALEVAHRHGVIHRDIKPDNIMFDADGTPKLADLGVAKFTDEAHRTTVTTTGMIIGTPAYMAPEQMMDSHHVDARADIYALGVVLYEMLTGKRPNADSTAVELLAKALKGEELPDVRTMRPEVSAAVAHVLSLMCAPKPESRPVTALETVHLLQKAATGRLALPKKPPRAVTHKGKRRIYIAAAVSAVIALSAIFTAVFLKRSERGNEVVAPLVVSTPNMVQKPDTAMNAMDVGVSATGTSVTASAPEKSVPTASEGENEEPDDAVSVPDEFTFKPPTPKFSMAVHEDLLGWFGQGEDLVKGTAIRVCHDLSHGGYPGTNRIFSSSFLADGNCIRFKPCWHDLMSENLDSINVLVLPSSSAQLLYGEEECSVIDKFLSRGGTVIAFVDANENNIWAMDKFFAPYGLEVFVMDEYPSMSQQERLEKHPAKPMCAAVKDLRPELKLDTFAAPANDSGKREWSGILTAGREGRTVFAARRVGNGHLVYASAGLQWYWYGGNKHARAVTGEENRKFWSGVFRSAARGCPMPDDIPMGERPVTDAPVMLSAGPITIYAAERWRGNANKLRDLVRQAVPIMERYCGRVLDPADMEQTKFVMTGTGIQGYVNVGSKTLVTGARFRGYPDKIGYFSEFVFARMMYGVANKGAPLQLPWYVANLVLADMGFPGEMTLRINEGKRHDANFSKCRLALDGQILDENGHEVKNHVQEIRQAKIFAALEDVRKRHPDVVTSYIKHVKNIYGTITRTQSVGILTEITGEDCFRIFEQYGIDCPRNLSAIDPSRVKKASQEGRPAQDDGLENTDPIELRGPYGLVVKAMPGCRTAAENILADLKATWLPAAVKFYGDPSQGKKPVQPFVMTIEREKGSLQPAYSPSLNGWQVFLPDGKNDFNLSMEYLCGAILTRVSEPSWAAWVFYVGFFVSDAIKGKDVAGAEIQKNIQIGREAGMKAPDAYKTEGQRQWATHMRNQYKLWMALEEVRAKDGNFIVKYCNQKNRARAEGKISETISWRQMAELMGDAVGLDVVEIFTRHGVDMNQVNARPVASRGETDRRVRYEKVGAYTWYYTIEKGCAVIWRGQNGYNNQTRAAIEPMPRGNVVVPERLGGRQVAAIGSLAFFRCKEMKGVTIPQGVSELRGWAFYDCTELHSVTLPSSLRSIRGHAFDYCPTLSAVDIGECISFQGDSFRNCSGLARVTVSPGNHKYKESGGAIYTVDMRELVFYPRTRTSLTIPQSVVTIGEGACEGCVLLQKVSVPRQIETVGKNAFSMCRELKEIKFEDGLKEVGGSAFSFCGMLEKVVFPASLERIGLSLFDGCRNLRFVEFAGNAPAADFSSGSVLGKTSDNLVIFVPPGSKGWSRPDSTELPQRWPVGAFEDSRPIRNARVGPAATKETDVKPKVDAGNAGAERKNGNGVFAQEFDYVVIRAMKVEKRYVEELEQILSEVIQKLDKRMGGAFIPEMKKRKTIVFFENKRDRGGRLKGHMDAIWISALDFKRRDHNRDWIVRSLVKDLVSLALYGTLYQSRRDPYKAREAPIVRVLLQDVFKSISWLGQGYDYEAHPANVKGCLEKDPGMNRYDYDGIPCRKPRARQLNARDKDEMVEGKLVWSFQELSEKYDDLYPLYWKARLEMKADLATPVSLDDMIVLLSIAANEDLLDWFLAHGLNKKRLDTKLKMPNFRKAK